MREAFEKAGLTKRDMEYAAATIRFIDDGGTFEDSKTIWESIIARRSGNRGHGRPAGIGHSKCAAAPRPTAAPDKPAVAPKSAASRPAAPPAPKLPTETQKAAVRLAGRVRAIGTIAPYHPEGMASFKKERARDLPARGRRALDTVKRTMTDTVLPKLTEGVASRVLYDRRETDNQTVPEIVPNVVEFNALIVESAGVGARLLGTAVETFATAIIGK
jgi:hypothetical protein